MVTSSRHPARSLSPDPSSVASYRKIFYQIYPDTRPQTNAIKHHNLRVSLLLILPTSCQRK